MKRIFILIICLSTLSFFNSCKKESKKDITTDIIGKTTMIKFEKELIDFGKLTEGEKVTCSFKFKNTGNSPLIISTVKANCGCTVADYPKETIAIGQEGLISVTFDSKNNGGMRVSKNITVEANTNPSMTTLRIVADVM